MRNVSYFVNFLLIVLFFIRLRFYAFAVDVERFARGLLFDEHPREDSRRGEEGDCRHELADADAGGKQVQTVGAQPLNPDAAETVPRHMGKEPLAVEFPLLREEMQADEADQVPDGFIEERRVVIRHDAGRILQAHLQKRIRDSAVRLAVHKVSPAAHKLADDNAHARHVEQDGSRDFLNNNCLGGEYNEEENVSDVDFMIKFLELLPKDMKYFLGMNYEINPEDLKILEMYKEFLTINKGFVNSKKNTDILLPSGMKTDGAENFKDKIDEVLKIEDLSKLLEYKDLICQI